LKTSTPFEMKVDFRRDAYVYKYIVFIAI
jgi:hypothetical protein